MTLLVRRLAMPVALKREMYTLADYMKPLVSTASLMSRALWDSTFNLMLRDIVSYRLDDACNNR